ncbi:hypothetical protein M0805_003991 [Coniferiporia weirii]|nr:hypothetical protein M0805_003991 [Coniferiporia weirii]
MKAAVGLRLVPKFVATYDKLFEGYTPEEISPHETAAQFWSNLLSLDVDRAHLGRRLRSLGKNELLAYHKPLLNTLVATCLLYLRTAQSGDAKKAHAAETLSVVVRCVLEKGLAGWEAMEVFAGSVGQSDSVFLNLTNTIEEVLMDDVTPVDVKHQVLQLAVVFACSINQLSPGAYLLRGNLFSAIAKIIKSPETESFTFEAALFLSIIANFHRSDAAKLNPYLRAIKDAEDRELMRSLVHSANYTMDSVVKAYQEVLDDSPPTFATSVSNLLASFRPDRALSATPVDPPRELFKNQPIEAAVILLPVHDFIHLNTVFNAVFLEPLISSPSPGVGTDTAIVGPADAQLLPPLVHTLLSLASYLLTHASSPQSARAAAYAALCLVTLLHLAENDVAMSALAQPPQPGAGPGSAGIRLCRQRTPLLPAGPGSRPALCALLDCCVLWLRHNLHKRLETQSYIICIWILHRIVWFLSRTKRRLDYHWEELWRSLISLLDFLSTKLPNSPKVEKLVQETIMLLDFSYCYAESYLGSPQAVHQLVYELARSTAILQKLQPFCQNSFDTNGPKRHGTSTARPADALRRLLDAAAHCEKKVHESGAHAGSASAVLRAIGREIERDGLYGGRERNEEEAPKHSDGLGEVGFVRFAYADGLTLMPGPDS